MLNSCMDEFSEFKMVVLGVMHILKLNGITEVNVGGLLRILGTPTASAEAYDGDFVALIADDQIASTTLPSGTVVH